MRTLAGVAIALSSASMADADSWRGKVAAGPLQIHACDLRPRCTLVVGLKRQAR
jgi:hypothetical protein